MSQHSPWIGVDLDGTLAFVNHDEPYVPTSIGKPIAPMVERVKKWLSEGRDVRIFTARVGGGIPYRDRLDIIMAIQRWTREHIGVSMMVTACKDYYLTEMWDDRAVKVKFNQGEPL